MPAPYATHRAQIKAILTAWGMPEENAEPTADILAWADLHGVEMEDEAVVESVQKGVRSRFYSHGRYSPTREQGTHHFHRLIAEFIG